MSAQAFEIRLAGSERSYVNPAGDNLLRAGLRAGVGLPYECNAGGCGSCKFDLLSGEVMELWPEAPGLSTKDRARGRRLACQCVPLSDCQIKIRADECFVPSVPPERFTAVYVGSNQVTRDIREFRFRGPRPANFLPGQYALLDLPGAGQLRAYSMSNQPNEAGDWDFMVRQVPQGRVSALLFESLSAGTEIQIDGPLGLAHLRKDSVRSVVCIAGGSGLAPTRSIVDAATAQPHVAGQEIWLFYGGRGPEDMPAFDGLLQAPERVNVHAAISVAQLADAAAWSGPRGFVHELVGQTLESGLDAHEYYVAGPPPMIETVVRMLMLEHKVPAQQIHFDRFF